MNRNTVIGFILMAAILFGFTWYNSKQYEKQMAYQAQLDSIARVEQAAQREADSIAWVLAHPEDTLGMPEAVAFEQEAAPETIIYKDSLLVGASSAEGETVTLSNGKLTLALNTKGAQPASAKIEDYKNYDGTPLYLFQEGASEMGYSIYAGEYINTKDFVFELVSKTDSSAVMRLPFSGGGYIEQEWILHNDSYQVDNNLRFAGMQSVIPRNVTVFDMDWKVTVPRMEKGYKNEAQYSMVNWYFSGEKKPESMGRSRNGSRRIDSKLSWFAFHQQFFSAIMRAEEEFSSGSISVDFVPEEDPGHNLMVCDAAMRYDYKAGQESVYANKFYFGPNHYKTLKAFDQKYEKIIPLGGNVVGIFTKYVIIPLFDFLHKFISNFGIIILLMTIFIKIVVFPFAFKSYSSSAKMQAIKPEIDKLNEKYPKQEDAMKKQQATMDLYSRAGISPMGGCLPMLLQFPILWAMFRFFPASIELRQQSFLWAEDLSGYDSIIDFGTRVPLLGDHISLFALLMAVSMFFYSKVTTGAQMSSSDPNQASMRFMSLYMMPIMMFFICNSLSSGLSYYYLLSNLITMIETWVIKKWFVHPEEILAKLKASAGKPAPKSKFQQRLEEAQRMQQQAAREQAKKNGRR